MKLSLTLSLVASASAFSPAFVNNAAQSNSALSAEMSRAAFLQTSVTAAAAALLSLAPQEAQAAKYGGIGRGSSGIVDPKDKIVDSEILASADVQASLDKIKKYLSVVEGLQSAIASNSQADIVPTIRKEFDFVEIRAALNTFNTAFDEETQRGTDRLIRIIIQDIDELEVNAKLKEGYARSEKRLGIVNGKLNKLACSLKDIIAFA